MTPAGVSGPIASGLTALVVITSVGAVISNSLVSIGVINAELNALLPKSLNLLFHTAGSLISVTVSSLSLLHANNAGVLRIASGCVIINSVQILAITIFLTLHLCLNAIWYAENFWPGITKRHWRPVKLSVLFTVLSPLVGMGASTIIFIQSNPGETSFISNSTNSTEACDWGIYPTVILFCLRHRNTCIRGHVLIHRSFSHFCTKKIHAY